MEARPLLVIKVNYTYQDGSASPRALVPWCGESRDKAEDDHELGGITSLLEWKHMSPGRSVGVKITWTFAL